MSVQGSAGNRSQRSLTLTPSWEAGEGHSPHRGGHCCSPSSALVSDAFHACRHGVRSLLLALEGAGSQIKVPAAVQQQLQELLPVSQCNFIVDRHHVIR